MAEIVKMRSFFDWLSWPVLVVGSLTLGLAPFVPEPHLVEKLGMLARGELSRPIDVLDLLMHAAFPLLLIGKTAASALRPAPRD